MKKNLLEKIPTGLSQTGASQTGASQTGASQTGASQTGVSQTGASQWQRLILVSFALIILAGGMTACGKRGEPYRPSEISTSDSY